MSIDPLTLALVLGGTAVSAHAQSKAQKRQQDLINQMALYRSQRAGEGREAIDKFLKSIEPQAQDQETQQIRSELEAGLKQGVGETMAFETPENFAGKISQDYRRVRGAGQKRTDERLARAIEQLKVIGTPGERALLEGRRFGNAANVVDASNSAARSVSGAYESAIANTQPDPGLMMLGQILSGVGQGMALTKGLPTPAAAAGTGLKRLTTPALGLKVGAGGLGFRG